MNEKEAIRLELAETALKQGFSIITPNAPCGHYFLTNAPVSIMCLQCYKQKNFDSFETLETALKDYKCKHNKKHLLNFSISSLVSESHAHQHPWGIDCLGIYTSGCETLHQGFAKRASFGEIDMARCSPIYFTNLEGRALLCYEVIERNSGNRGGCFIAQLNSDSCSPGHISRGAYIEGSSAKMLLDSISKKTQESEDSPAASENADLYIKCINTLFDPIVSSYTGSLSSEDTVQLNSELQDEISEEPVIHGNHYFARYLSAHACPVCHRYHTSKDVICPNCGFSLEKRFFLNRDEAELWRKEVVEPYRKTVPYLEYRPLYALWASREAN